MRLLRPPGVHSDPGICVVRLRRPRGRANPPSRGYGDRDSVPGKRGTSTPAAGVWAAARPGCDGLAQCGRLVHRRGSRGPGPAGPARRRASAPAASSTVAARRARDGSSVMIVSATTGRTPSSGDGVGERRVHRVEHEHVGDVRVQPRHAERRRLVAERDQHPVGGSLERAAADDRADGDDRDATRRGRRRSPPGSRAPPGSARPRRSGWTGTRRSRRRPPSAASDLGRRHERPRRPRAGSRARRVPAGDARSTPGTRASRRRSAPRSAPARRPSAGSARATPSDAWRPRHTSVSRAPARSRAVRAMCSARSRSPSENQSCSPYAASCAIVAWVSPSMPQPHSTCSIPARL